MNLTDLHNDLTQPIYAEIARAETAAELHEISRTRIPHCVGISDDERAQLELAVRAKFSAWNATAIGQPKARWDVLPQTIETTAAHV